MEANSFWKITVLFIFIFVLNIVSIAQKVDTAHSDSLNLMMKIVPEGDRKENNTLYTGIDLTEKSFKGSWPMFGTDLRMKIGGYFKADFVYDLNGSLDEKQFLMSTIPVEGQLEYGNGGYTSFFANETRFNIDVRKIKKGEVPLQLFIEGDFFNAAGTLRLRHAYVVVGDFMIGQNWTTLSFLEALPFLIDFAAGDALFGGRTVQVRYQKKLKKNFQISLALEQVSYLGIENPNNLPGAATRKLPLLAARLDYSWKTGLFIFGGSATELGWEGGNTGTNASALQYNLALAGRQYLGKKTYFTWTFNFGDGAGENIMAFAGSNANAVLTDKNLETMQSVSAGFGAMHKWASKLSSNFSYAYGWLDVPPSRDAYALKKGGVTHINLIYNPLPYVSTGIEYMWGTQITSNDARGSAGRIQFMTKVSF